MTTPRRRSRRRAAADPLLVARRRKRRLGRVRGRRRRSAAVALGGAGVVAIVLVVAGVTGGAVFLASCDLNSLRPVAIGENSFVYAADGSLLGSIPAERNRTPVPLRRMGRWLPRATVAIEDRRFYAHGGVDLVGIGRAIVADVRAGRIVQGGSTITQQLVRNLYISKERTFGRKATEACLAWKLARQWSKRRILTAYLNQVYYGGHAYGVEAAAQTYFSRPARKLTLLQAALIAGLPQAPSVYDPFHRPQQALARRNEVLRALLSTHAITSSRYARLAARTSLGLRPGRLYSRIREPYFFDYVRTQLQEKYGSNTVRSGGLRVYTTIDPRLQSAAKRASRATLPSRSDPATAVVAIDPRNGAIRAMTEVAPANPRTQVNFAADAHRQAGSTFKTFVLATAVEQGIDPATTSYLSAPFAYQPVPGLAPWSVTTYDKTYLGATSIERATLHSDNTVYARLTLDVGPERVAEMARRLGVRSRLTTREGAIVPSIGLGSAAVTPLDMATAYATLAAGGIRSEPLAIRKVVLADGHVDREAGWGRSHRTRVLPDWVAAEVTRILEENIQVGTGTGAAFGQVAAGKTGTTDDYRDAWFCGYTPRLASTVWIGFPKGEIPMRNVHGIQVSGPTFPATVWRLFMTSAVGGLPELDFPPPGTSPHWRTHELQYAFRGAPAPPPPPPPPPTTQAATTTAARASTSSAAATTASATTPTEAATTSEAPTTSTAPSGDAPAP